MPTRIGVGPFPFPNTGGTRISPCTLPASGAWIVGCSLAPKGSENNFIVQQLQSPGKAQATVLSRPLARIHLPPHGIVEATLPATSSRSGANRKGRLSVSIQAALLRQLPTEKLDGNFIGILGLIGASNLHQVGLGLLQDHFLIVARACLASHSALRRARCSSAAVIGTS